VGPGHGGDVFRFDLPTVDHSEDVGGHVAAVGPEDPTPKRARHAWGALGPRTQAETEAEAAAPGLNREENDCLQG
jgi:hypothetical protein